jgi:hypothetical protein
MAWSWNGDPGSVLNGTGGTGSISSAVRSADGRISAHWGSMAVPKFGGVDRHASGPTGGVYGRALASA